MGLRHIFGFSNKAKESEIKTSGSPLLSLQVAAQFLKDAGSCLNACDGPEFVHGIRAAFIPLQQCVTAQVGRETEYGDTLHEYAKLTRNNPEQKLNILWTLASHMKGPCACGVRFVIADLILAYASIGAYPHGSVKDLLKLRELSISILEGGSQFG